MNELEITSEIKTKDPNPQGLALVFSDRLNIKSKVPKWKNFPPCTLSRVFIRDYENVKNFKVHEDDIWLCGFPRSGTTVIQELLWLIVNNYNFEGAKAADTYNRANWFDYFYAVNELQGVAADHLDKMPRPRVFKTHSPVQFLPDQVWTVKPRIVHIKRDVKDVAVSNYFLRRNTFHDDVGSIEECFEDFLTDKTWWSPYREHVIDYENIPDYDNIIYVSYEEYKADTDGTIKKLVKFLKKEINDEQLKALREHLSFDKMKASKTTNMQHYMELFNQLSGHDRPTDGFVRKGIVGDYKNQMTEEMIKRFNDFTAAAKNIKPSW